MGQSWSGTPPGQVGYAQNYNQPQQQGFNQFASSAGQYDIGNNPLYQQAASSLSQSPFMKSFDPTQYEKYFQEGVANPTMRMYEQQVVPQLRQNYYSPGSGGVYGSALNQALNQSAQELTTGLGGLRANYLQQGQQQHATGQLASIAQALGLAQAPAQGNLNYFGQLFGAKPVSPLIQEAQSGWLQDVLKLLANTGGQAANGYAQGLAKGGLG